MASYIKIGRLIARQAGRFGLGQFGKARFGIPDIYAKVSRNSLSFTKVARPYFGAAADSAQADYAAADTTDGYVKIPRPT